jgi:hypothetical protein
VLCTRGSTSRAPQRVRRRCGNKNLRLVPFFKTPSRTKVLPPLRHGHTDHQHRLPQPTARCASHRRSPHTTQTLFQKKTPPAEKCSPPRCATATLITSTACHNPPHGALRTAEVRTPPRHSSKKNPSRTKVHHSLTASPMHRIATRWTWTHCSTPKLRNS